MLVLSMKNDFEYLFTISRVADRSGPPPEHADYSILHFSKMTQIKGKPSNSENMSKSGGHTSPMRGVLSVLGLSIDHIDPLYSVCRRRRPPGDQKTFPEHANYSYFHFLRLKKKQSQKHKKYNMFVFFGLVLLPEMPYVCQHLFQAYTKYIGCK